MRKFLATLLALVMTLALMVPASWGENKETYQLPDSLEGKTVILHTNDVHGAKAPGRFHGRLQQPGGR